MPWTRGDFEALAKSSGDQRETSLGVTSELARVTHLEMKMSLKQTLLFEVYKDRCYSFHYIQLKLFKYSSTMPLRGSGELLKNHIGGGFNRFRRGNR